MPKGDPINFSDSFWLCPEEQRDEDGRCPGGLSVEEWEAVEASMEHMSEELAGTMQEWLDAGKIRGADLAPEMHGRANQFTQRIQVNRTIGGTNNGFLRIRPEQMAFLLGHEYGPILDARSNIFTRLFFGIQRATFRQEYYEHSADIYACAFTTGGQPYNLGMTCPGR